MKIAKGKSVPHLHIEVRQNKTINRIFINTYIKLKPSEYSDKNGFTCKNHPNATAITAKVHRIFSEVEEFVLSDNHRALEYVKNWDKYEYLRSSSV